MPKIEIETIIQASPENVFRRAQEIERYPDFAPELREVKVLSREGNVVRSRWVGIAEVGPLRREVTWEEIDVWDEEKLECRFELMSGDMKSYAGVWKFERNADGLTHCSLLIDYELGIPLLGQLLEKLIHEKVTEVAQAILTAVKELAETQG